MTIEEAIVKSGFKNALDVGSRKYAQKSLASNETLLFAYNGNIAVVPSDTELDPGKVFSVKKKVSGIMAITDKRVFVCNSTLGSTFFKELPLKRIQSIDDAGNALLGTAQLRIKGLTEIFVIDLNKKQKALIPEVKSTINSAIDKAETPQAVPVASSGIDQLMKLKELLDAGLITKEEFEKEKDKYLG